MSKNLLNRRNYKTINLKEDKSTQTSSKYDNYIRNIIATLVDCCCPMPNLTRKTKNNTSEFINPVIHQPINLTKKQKILREIEENFSDSSTDSEDWVNVENNSLV